MNSQRISSPHAHSKQTTASLMRLVIYCMTPALLVQSYFFGTGVWVQLMLACFTAVICEALVLGLRQRSISASIFDGSALLTGFILALAIPPLAPWWIIVIGTAFSIIVVKQLYGGLGQNLFNPAMAGYVLLLIAFPLQMTQWLPPQALANFDYNLQDAFSMVFTEFTVSGYDIGQLKELGDGVSQATPLDSIKTGLSQGNTISDITSSRQFDGTTGIGWFWVNLAFLTGGLLLLVLNKINWRIPVSFLSVLTLVSIVGYLADPDQFASPVTHLFSGATMMCAWFIATDPVSASTTPRGRLVFGALIGLLVYVIRTFGGYPDGVAFAVLLANIAVPLIDHWTIPRTYGMSKS